MTDKKTEIWVKLMAFFGKYWGCHQLPHRSYFIYGYQFPLCARCMGIFIGELSALVLLISRVELPLLYAFAFLLPTVIDGLIQFKLRRESTNSRRLLTGIVAGIGIAYCIFDVLYIVLA